MGAAKHPLRYLAGTVDFTITYTQGGFRLNACSVANWGNNPDNGKSTSSCIAMMMCNGPVSFKVSMQGLTAQSTMGAELAARALAKEAVFRQNMIMELGFKGDSKCVPIHILNTSALHVAENQTESSRAKQVALRSF